MRGIRRSIDAQLGEKLYAELPKAWDMTNTNAGRGPDPFLLNREFIKAETTAYIDENYPNHITEEQNVSKISSIFIRRSCIRFNIWW